MKYASKTVQEVGQAQKRFPKDGETWGATYLVSARFYESSAHIDDYPLDAARLARLCRQPSGKTTAYELPSASVLTRSVSIQLDGRHTLAKNGWP